jgi:hypothetical protein
MEISHPEVLPIFDADHFLDSFTNHFPLHNGNQPTHLGVNLGGYLGGSAPPKSAFFIDPLCQEGNPLLQTDNK